MKGGDDINNLSQQDEMTILALCSVSLISELHNHNFLESDYFNNMPFANASVKETIKKHGLNNKAMLSMFLYSLLLLPKETMYTRYRSDFDEIDRDIDSEKISCEPSNPNDKQYIRHIRNAVAHGGIEQKEESFIFKDIDTRFNTSFIVEIHKNYIGVLLMDLQKIIFKHIEILKDS